MIVQKSILGEVGAFAQMGTVFGAGSVQQPPEVVTPPEVTGAPYLNRPLSTTGGTWNGDPTLTYQWQESQDGNAWSDIPGATAIAFSPVFANRQNLIRVEVTATNGAGSATATSDPTAAVAPLDFAIYGGSDDLNGFTGFSRGSFGTLQGDEPMPDYQLAALFSRSQGYSNFAFEGDCADVLAGLSVTLEPVPDPWGAPAADWDLVNDETQIEISPTGMIVTTEPTAVTWVEVE